MLHQVFKSLLKGQYGLGKVIETHAVGTTPLTHLVLESHFNDNLRQRHGLTVSFDDISKYGGSDSAHFENYFGFFHHVPHIPDRLD